MKNASKMDTYTLPCPVSIPLININGKGILRYLVHTQSESQIDA